MRRRACAGLCAVEPTLSTAPILRLALAPRPRLEPRDLHQAHRVAGEALDLAHEVAVGVAEEGHGDAGAPGTAGAADAVDVVLRLARGVVVHHQVDARH